MKQSQIEIKSIEAELRSIRAETKSSRSVSLLEVGTPSYKLSQAQAQDQTRNAFESSAIAPTIVRSSTTTTQDPPPAPNVQPKQKREVKCFPISTQAQTATATQAQLSAVVEQLRHHSSHVGTKKSAQRSNRQTHLQADTIRQLLEEKAKQINALSTQQEAAILELMNISGKLNQEFNDLGTAPELNKLSLECEIADIPYVERDRNGILILTNRSIDRTAPNERTAATIAKPSRQHGSRRNVMRSIGQVGRWLSYPFLWIGAVGLNSVRAVGWGHQTTPRRTYRGSGRRATPAVETPVTLKEAATLVIGSTLLRIFLDWLVVGYPMLWVPSILVMLTPAAFAIYRSTVKPPTGFAWGYRLFAILIGLLLGGRL